MILLVNKLWMKETLLSDGFDIIFLTIFMLFWSNET